MQTRVGPAVSVQDVDVQEFGSARQSWRVWNFSGVAALGMENRENVPHQGEAVNGRGVEEEEKAKLDVVIYIKLIILCFYSSVQKIQGRRLKIAQKTKKQPAFVGSFLRVRFSKFKIKADAFTHVCEQA